MKSAVNRFRPELEKLMAAARAAIAAQCFDAVKVKSELAAAAKAGRSSCVLQVDGPLDLRHAPATQTLLAWIEREGLRSEWIRRPVGDVDGDAAWDLLVSWRPHGDVQHVHPHDGAIDRRAAGVQRR